jgi:hypothetical protein
MTNRPNIGRVSDKFERRNHVSRFVYRIVFRSFAYGPVRPSRWFAYKERCNYACGPKPVLRRFVWDLGIVDKFDGRSERSRYRCAAGQIADAATFQAQQAQTCFGFRPAAHRGQHGRIHR